MAKFAVRFAHDKLLMRATNNTKRRLLLLQGSLRAHDFHRAFSEVINKVYKWVPANLMLGGNPAMD